MDYHLKLLSGLCTGHTCAEPAAPPLQLPPGEVRAVKKLLGPDPFVVIHPGTARPEKFWIPERWASVIRRLRDEWSIRVVLTGGSDPFEQEHLHRIQAALSEPCLDLSGKISLSAFAAVLASARLCVSTDTGALHLAAAFRVPQIALFGPTNPFHWRPRHSRAAVFWAAHPESALTRFEPRMKGAPMDRIEAEPVARHACELLALNPVL